MDREPAWREHLDRAILAHEETITSVRRHLHRYPEPSGQEIQTTQYLEHLVEDTGLAPRRPENGCGLIVDSPGTSPTRVALRADIDALRIQDTKKTAYRSHVDGLTHACGHDGHTAAVVGALLGIINAGRHNLLPWPVDWRVIFQSAEETNEGALAMIGAGAIDDVSAIFSLHADPSRPTGCVGVSPGPITAECRFVEIHLRGVGGHAARPHEARDPLASAIRLMHNLYGDLGRRLNAHDPVVFTIGQVVGATSPNVIPDTVTLRGTLRSLDTTVGDTAYDRIVTLGRAETAASGVDIDVSGSIGPPSVTNDPDLAAIVTRCAEHVVGPDGVQPITEPSMGGEDFANYQTRIPGCLFRLGCALGPHGSPPLHASDFDLDEAALPLGSRILARCLVEASKPCPEDP